VSTATTIPFTENEALRTYGGPLPGGIDREDYENILGNLEADGLESLEIWEINDIKRVIEYQKSINVKPTCAQPFVTVCISCVNLCD
jgi:hypothetical protein